jgi:riboflavin synthase
MFTGIVAAVGKIKTVTPLEGGHDAGVRLDVDAGGLPMADVALGDSIALNGACMTVVEKTETGFTVDVSRESLNCTVGLDTTTEVNLEKALTLAERLVIEAPRELAKYLAFKGSVVVNGVSLTVNRVNDTGTGCEFSINLIPHTIQVTTLKHLKADVQVNLEIDLIARYVERMLSVKGA